MAIAAAVAAPLAGRPSRARPRAVAAWLLVVAALVLAMVVIGGVTRLTESGLSMVRWEPVAGIVPPLSDTDWLKEFAHYRASPQGRLVNAGMDLAAFKGIFFWEYLHRVVARVFVAVLLVPMAAFALLGAVPAGYGRRLWLLFALGCVEPVFGWWMVASGLADRPSVAPERLAVHLVTALLIIATALWTALDLSEGRRRLPGWTWPALAALAVQIVWGAFTAGLRAGHASDTWPLMLGAWVPPLGHPVADPLTVQFIHRSFAWVVAAGIGWAAWCGRAAGGRAATVVALVALQIALGIATIVDGVPIPIAAAHQAGAALLLAALLWLGHAPRASAPA